MPRDPLTHDRLKLIEAHAAKVFQEHTDLHAEIIKQPTIKRASKSSLNTLSKNTNLQQARLIVQSYLDKLGYNHTIVPQMFPIDKMASIVSLYKVAKDMIHCALPIRCLEAVILSLFLTTTCTSIDRMTISFVSQVDGDEHRHIVLGTLMARIYLTSSFALSRKIHDSWNK